MLQRPEMAIAEVVLQGGADLFYSPGHRLLYDSLLDLWNDGEPIDLISLTNKLEVRNRLDSVGGPSQVAGLINEIPPSEIFPVGWRNSGNTGLKEN